MQLFGGGAPDLGVLRDFTIALFIGALIGVERERKREVDPSQFGGLRTFILVALAGALAVAVGDALGTPLVFAGGLLGVGALIAVAYVQEGRRHAEMPGLTTEFAALVTYLLGGAVLAGLRGPAVMLAIATSAVLTFKQDLHKVVHGMTRDDVVAGLKLLFATFIVLPLLPDRALDPWGALNPYKLWLLVVLISALSLIGYVAVRWLGEKRGLSLTGVFGGLVSSTAVTLAFARQSREEGAQPQALALGLMLAWAVMFVRVVVLVLVVNARLLGVLWRPVVAMLVVTLLCALYLSRRGPAEAAPQRTEVVLKNPFSLWSAIQFGLFFAVILLVVALARAYLPDQWLYGVATLAGTTDVDAIILSLGQQSAMSLSAEVAALGTVLACLSNTAVKAGMVGVLGTREMARPVFVSGTLIAVAGIASWASTLAF